MRLLPSSFPLVLLPLILPAAAEEAPPAATPPPSADDSRQRADESMAATSRVDAALKELGEAYAPATALPDSPMPEAPEGQSVAVSDGGLFFDSANSQLVYLHNVRLSDERVKLRAANRLYIQLPPQGEEKKAEAPQGTPAPEGAAPPEGNQAAPAEAPAPEPKPAPQPAPQDAKPAGTAQPAPDAGKEEPQAPALPWEIVAYDALADSVTNRMLFTSGPGVPELSFRQGESRIVLTQGEGAPARALADEAGNILLEAPAIHMRWKAEDGTFSEFRTTGGRVLYHAASHALVMEGPVEASYRNGESRMQCSGPFCATLQPEKEAASGNKSGFMSQFSAMRFSGVAAASATGNVQLSSRRDGEQGMSISGDALYYNGLTGEIEVPGTPCILTYGKDGCNTLQTEGSLVVTPEGDIHFKGDGSIEGSYERPAREEGGTPLRGTLSALAPLSFHAANGTVTTRALNARDTELSISCTGDVEMGLTPLTAEELAKAKLPTREKAGMVNLAIARYNGISTIKASGQVRGELLGASEAKTPEATLSASVLNANLVTGEMLLTGKGETASIAFRGYSLSGTADALTPASVQLKANGDIEARGARVNCTLPGAKGLTTLSCTDRMLLAREPRSLSLGSGTRIQSPDGIVTTRGPMQAVLAAGTKPAKPLSPRFPHLVYDFSGLESAETFEGATVRTAKGSLQCTRHLSILMQPAGQDKPKSPDSGMGGIRSAIATGQVLIAAKDGSGRVMRAAGDRLEVDGTTGSKRLTGSRVVLEDARNRHEASGAGAAVHIDARNNARITGANQSTSATKVREQVEENDKKNKQNKPN